MDFADGTIAIGAFMALNLGIVVVFVGRGLTASVSGLREYNIPEPVSGGLLVAIATLAVYVTTGREVAFDLAARDALLIYFFTIVGLNARVSDLLQGGRPLAILLALTIVAMLIQTAVGMAMALLAGLPAQTGVLLGTAALIGGHGTAIAWGPIIGERFGVSGAEELAIAAATLGLIMASFAGGPVARRLIERHHLSADSTGTDGFVVPADTFAARFDHTDVMRSLLAIHLSIVVGFAIYEAIEEAGLLVPRFLPCLLTAIVLSNTLPRIVPRLAWPARTPATAMISDFALSIFLAMSLMSMQLWTLGGSIGLLLLSSALQLAAMTAFIFLVVFRLMGRNYFAAVLSAGFAGFTLGATPNAIANMGAVTRTYGPAPLAFIVLPLVSAFFVDIANATLIQLVVSW